MRRIIKWISDKWLILVYICRYTKRPMRCAGCRRPFWEWEGIGRYNDACLSCAPLPSAPASKKKVKKIEIKKLHQFMDQV